MKEAKHLTIYPKHNHVKFKATTVALLESHGWRGCCTTPSCCLQLFCLFVTRRKLVKLLGKWFPPSPHTHTHTSARERSEEKAESGKCDSQQIKGLRTISWRKEAVHDVYIPVSKHNRCSKLLHGIHHYDFTLTPHSYEIRCTQVHSKLAPGERPVQ